MRSAASATLALAVLVLAPLAPSVLAQDAPPPDICLTLGLGEPDDDLGAALADAVSSALGTRPILIPAPQTLVAGTSTSLVVAVWTEAPGSVTGTPTADESMCGAAPAGGSWRASISGEFLRAGTRRELAAAPTTPGFSSSIDVEWDEAADRVRTVLTFSGPLDIPNGTCWLDDVVAADGQGGTRVETTTGSRTSPFGDGVCGRFEEYLASGGAGAQALVLLPREVAMPDGSVLGLRVDSVDVRDGGVHLTGSVEGVGS